MATLTLDIGGTSCAVACTDDDGVHLLETWATGEPDDTLRRTLAYLRSLPDRAPSVDRIGVCFGGPVAAESGTVKRSVHAAGWHGFDFRRWAQREAGLPLAIDNDANVGALAEQRHGGHGDVQDLVYVTISTGIGAGVISSGRLVRGATGDAGELGHLRVTDAAITCNCGRDGCLERMCSGYWLERDHGRPAKELLASDEFLADYAATLARGLAGAVLLYNPALIVLGGGVSRTGQRLADAASGALAAELGSWSDMAPAIAVSRFDAEGVHWGAMELARDLL